jgi:two-component system CitB family response regulator
MKPSPLKVLIVEDDPKIAEIQQRFLARIDDVELVGIAHSLANAQDLVEVFNPQLALLDVQLPDGSGLDILRQWRASNETIDVILITAAKEVDTVRQAMHAGVFEYILKPLVFERLEEAIKRFQTHLQTLENIAEIEQSDVDSLIAKPLQSSSPIDTKKRLPKGIDAITLENIQNLMLRSGSLTAEEVGQEIGASRTTARRYLEYLVSENQVKADVAYGSVGRPERRYSAQ